MTGWSAQLAELARVGRYAVEHGLVVASGGNLSVRGPGGELAVTGRGTFLDRLDEEAFAVLAADGGWLSGPEPSSEWRLHQRTYLRRPDVAAIVHLHPAYTVLLDALGYPIRLLTLDHVAYLGTIARIPFLPNGSVELAEAAAQAAAGSDCVVMAHHGCSALGRSVADAFRVTVNLESAAQATYRMLLLGDRTTQFPPKLRDTAIHRDS